MRPYIKEFFTHFDICVMCVLLVAGWTVILPHASEGTIWLALIMGMAGYALSEYMIHRFLFHMKPPEHPLLLTMLRRLHYDHHIYPNELHLLFLPVWYSLPVMVGPVLIAYLVTRDTVLTIAFVTGVISFLLYYEWTHFVAHRPIKPITPWGRWMKKVHLWHHYKSEHYWYGVTNPLFDVMLGTFRDEQQVEKSETARNLEGKADSRL
ncbi:sterol desaturase family protein [Paenibacillus tyrfis]|uniref:Fatty acid hydroxylase n=1 Tax=Paenibacillus tyrfis TaxID=1501230 RepID=A0A081NTF1_9BACL|nr:sterol desaturase family protein [Paenibacillus tyrfis]KEQ21724.1 fatty acid hydroxylase [Paenibacillus tyrfis]